MTSAVETVVAGTACRLLRPIRDREGRLRYEEHPRILRRITNLEREMFLVRFDDGATTFVFPDEIVAC
jgi:predicted thioredoxin/glutaredoxin